MSRAKKMTVPEEEYMTNNRDMPPQELADNMGRSYEFVRKFLKTLPEEPKTKANLHQIHMVTETASGKKGVAIMTKAASELADAKRKGRKKVLGPPNSIRKIRDE